MSSRRTLTRNSEEIKEETHKISTRMGGAEQRIGETDTWNTAVKEILEQSLKCHHPLEAKLTEL